MFAGNVNLISLNSEGCRQLLPKALFSESVPGFLLTFDKLSAMDDACWLRAGAHGHLAQIMPESRAQ